MVSPKGQFLNVQVIGKTHLVQLEKDSLIKGTEKQEISEKDSLTIDVSTAVTSRRGPNQEVFEQIDLRKSPMYNWYPVKTINDEPSKESWYVREDAFVNEGRERIGLLMTCL